jgi:hypothetical protein
MPTERLHQRLVEMRRRLDALDAPYERWLRTRISLALHHCDAAAPSRRLRDCVLLADLQWIEGRLTQASLVAATAESLGVPEPSLRRLRDRVSDTIADRETLTELYLEAWGDAARA